MDDKHRTILRKHRTALVDNLEPSKLLNSLDVLDDDDRDKLKSVQIRKEQAEELLDILSRRGPEAFQNFVAALYKSQEFLAKRLIQEQDSGIDVSTLVRDDIGMTSQHKQILRRSVQNLHHMDLHKMLPYLSGLLDELDKQSLLNTANPASQRVDMLLTEILPRKGPKAFEGFVQALERVEPSMAQKLLQEAGIKGSSNGATERSPIQESFSLDTPVQVILDEKPEVFKKFKQLMDEKDVWGNNGWKRLYKELGLPAGWETALEGRDGESPTLNVIKGWISREGGSATVQALLKAVNRSERKDCSSNLEKSLGCQLDCVDNVTVKMESLTFVGPREVKFFGDLDDSQASLIASKLGQNGEALLRRELGNDSLSTKELMQQPQSKKYPIRKYTDLVPKGDRDKVIKAFREALPRYKGVSGPLLLPDTFIRDFGYTYRRNLTKHLCADDSWKFLGEKLGMDNATIKYLDARRIENPADEVLRFWEVKAFSTVGALYDILVELECPYIADLL